MLPSRVGRRVVCTGLMLAPAAARAQLQDARFAVWLRGVRTEAVRVGVDERTAEMALGSASQIPQVLDLARNQPEFKMTFDHYMGVVVSPERVSKGRMLLRQNRTLVERFATPVGLPASVVVALWGIESNYGARLGDFEVVSALASLAFNGFRASFFRAQLIAALKILAQGHVALHQMKGSWAGAMGQCQFIPTTFLMYAADGDGDGRYDIWTSKADVFASTVNYLHRAGWQPGLRWGEEVDAGARPKRGERIVRPSGAGGPAYRTTENFRTILRWNQSDFFALAVGLLSDRIAS